jgi:hypothetical protein
MRGASGVQAPAAARSRLISAMRRAGGAAALRGMRARA